MPNDYDYTKFHVAKSNGGMQIFERRLGRIVTDAHGRPKGIVPNGNYSYDTLMAFKSHPSDKIVSGWVLVPVTIKD